MFEVLMSPARSARGRTLTMEGVFASRFLYRKLLWLLFLDLLSARLAGLPMWRFGVVCDCRNYCCHDLLFCGLFCLTTRALRSCDRDLLEALLRLAPSERRRRPYPE